MRLSLVSSLWMLLVFGAFATFGERRNLISQEAGAQIKSGDLELETSRVYVRVGIKPYSKMLGAVGVTDRLLIYGDLIVAP